MGVGSASIDADVRKEPHVVPGLPRQHRSKTGKTPNEFVAMAREKGSNAPDTRAGTIVDWLKEDFGLGRGHAMALVHVIKNGAQIDTKHVGTDGVHRDESTTLRLDGKDAWRAAAPLRPRSGFRESFSEILHQEGQVQGVSR